MDNIAKAFLFCGVFFGDVLCADLPANGDNSNLSLLKSAVSSGIDPAKLISDNSLNANELLLSARKEKSPSSIQVGKPDELRKDAQKRADDKSNATDSSEGLGFSASTLPNNAKQLDEKDKYFGQHELCESEIIKAEKRHGIPNRLLLAISTVESGRAVGKSKRPWPWTICANGRGYYCTTKSAAIATVKRLMARGIRNIDVGCMQVNLLHHSTAFKNLEEAFTPKSNVNYAARFFMSLRNTYNSWTHAVGYYHSKAARHYKPYCSLVYNTWNKVRNFQVRDTPVIARAASKIKSDISFLPSYYSLVDNSISAKLHQLGRKTLVRSAPKFFVKKKK